MAIDKTTIKAMVINQAYNIGRFDGERDLESCQSNFETPREREAYRRGYKFGRENRCRLYANLGDME